MGKFISIKPPLLQIDPLFGHKKRESDNSDSPFSSGDTTRTCDLRVMSPTSYLLLHPAMYLLSSEDFVAKTGLEPVTFGL